MLTFFTIELRKLLRRPRLLIWAAVLIPVAHFLVLRYFWNELPFSSSFTAVLVGFVEIMFIAFVFLRIGQELDPDGPLGPTEDERKIRNLRL